MLTDVAVSHGAGPVVSGVSMTVEPGSVTAVVGPNGAGKTSLLESISGIVASSHGRMELDGTDITRMERTARFRRGLLHVEQGRAVFPSLTVEENLRLTCPSPAALGAALEPFPELAKLRRTPTGLLSGGEQQMVVLARSLGARPRYLLIDEMSLGLAPVIVTRLLPVVARIAEDGTGIVLVEQFTNLALGIAREALVVSGGRVTFHGPADRLLADQPLLHRSYLGLDDAPGNDAPTDAASTRSVPANGAVTDGAAPPVARA